MMEVMNCSTMIRRMDWNIYAWFGMSDFGTEEPLLSPQTMQRLSQFRARRHSS
jgi:hypothetical protein